MSDGDGEDAPRRAEALFASGERESKEAAKELIAEDRDQGVDLRALLRDWWQGDRDAGNRFVRVTHEDLRRFFLKWENVVPMPADDAVQMTFHKLQTSPTEDLRDARGWLFGIAKNVARNACRLYVRDRGAFERTFHSRQLRPSRAGGDIREKGGGSFGLPAAEEKRRRDLVGRAIRIALDGDEQALVRAHFVHREKADDWAPRFGFVNRDGSPDGRRAREKANLLCAEKVKPKVFELASLDKIDRSTIHSLDKWIAEAAVELDD